MSCGMRSSVSRPVEAAAPRENRDSTSYGVTRRPKTSRLAHPLAHRRTGWKAMATTTAPMT